ncbi:MAG: PBECR4 domain-containing protein [Oscillospiraceae bacterium]
MDKRQAAAVVTDCARKYENQLSGTNLMFVATDKTKYYLMETDYKPQYFFHLTGLKSIQGETSYSFYNKCIRGQLRTEDIELDRTGIAEQKLSVLPQLMDIAKNARMLGTYNYSKPVLLTDEVVGNNSACMGFRLAEDIYIPNTVLKEDLRRLTHSVMPVMAVFQKLNTEEQYTSLTYRSKKFFHEQTALPEDIRALLSPQLRQDQNLDPPTIFLARTQGRK